MSLLLAAVALASTPATVGWPEGVTGEATTCRLYVGADADGRPYAMEVLECPPGLRPAAARHVFGGRFAPSGAVTRYEVALAFDPAVPAAPRPVEPTAQVNFSTSALLDHWGRPRWPDGVEATGDHVCQVRVVDDPSGTPFLVEGVSCPPEFLGSAAEGIFDWRFAPGDVGHSEQTVTVRYHAGEEEVVSGRSRVLAGVRVDFPDVRAGVGVGYHTRFVGAWGGLGIETGLPAFGAGIEITPVSWTWVHPHLDVQGWLRVPRTLESSKPSSAAAIGLRIGRDRGPYLDPVIGMGRSVWTDRHDVSHYDSGWMAGVRVGWTVPTRARSPAEAAATGAPPDGARTSPP